MGHNGLDKKHLFLEIHAGDEAVLVTADVEGELPPSRRRGGQPGCSDAVQRIGDVEVDFRWRRRSRP